MTRGLLEQARRALRRAVIERKLTIEQLAWRTKLHPRTIDRWLSFEHANPRTMDRIATALHLEWDLQLQPEPKQEAA